MKSSNRFILWQACALIFAATAISVSGCREQSSAGSAGEKNSGSQATSSASETTPKPSSETPTDKKPATPSKTTDQAEKTTPTEATDQAKSIRFLSYNLKNYLTMGRYIDGKRVQASKPESEIEPLIKLIASSQPDVLGVCEIGDDDDLADLQKRLKAAGVDLPHRYRSWGEDKVRSLGLLSKYPIVSTARLTKTSHTISGTEFHISRGVLDATIKFPKRTVRFLGCHLKSKRPVPEADQEIIRRNESRILRQHIEDIIAQKPETELIVYGDFNDTKRTVTLRTAMGRLNAKDGLIVLNPTDSRGDSWTHHWKREDIYSRFDFVMVSKNLAKEVDAKKCRILDPAYWEQASDHRAILLEIP